MTAEELIRQIQEDASEWIEMSEDPAMVIAGVLAGKVIELKNHVEYLERRLNYDRISRNIERYSPRQ